MTIQELVTVVVPASMTCWLWWRLSRPHKVLTPDHYVELATRLAQSKPVILERIEEVERVTPITTDDPRFWVTSAGLAVAYTIGREGDSFVHHYSISLAGRYTSMLIGCANQLFVAEIMNLPADQLRMQRSEKAVFHAQCCLTREQQESFANTVVQVPSVEHARAITKRLTSLLRKRA